MLASVCLYAAGMVLNDHADRKLDRVLRPERPLPRGAIAPTAALAFGLSLLAACIWLSPIPWLHGSMGLLVLAYNYLLKHIHWLGAVSMGCLRGGNLMLGALALGHDPQLQEPLVICAAAYGIYIMAVTILGIMEDQPRVQWRAMLGLCSLPPVVTTLALLSPPQPYPAVLIALVLGLLFLRECQGKSWDQNRIRARMRNLLLGTMLFTALCCLASQRAPEALCILVAAFPARWISRYISPT